MEYLESTTNMIANNKVSQEELGPVSAIRCFTHMNISSARQTNKYVIGLSELKRQEQRDEMDGTRWQLLFDESSRYWGKVCLRGESALRNNGIDQPQLRITSVDIGVKLDGHGVKELALKDLTSSEKSLLIQ